MWTKPLRSPDRKAGRTVYRRSGVRGPVSMVAMPERITDLRSGNSATSESLPSLPFLGLVLELLDARQMRCVPSPGGCARQPARAFPLPWGHRRSSNGPRRKNPLSRSDLKAAGSQRPSTRTGRRPERKPGSASHSAQVWAIRSRRYAPPGAGSSHKSVLRYLSPESFSNTAIVLPWQVS